MARTDVVTIRVPLGNTLWRSSDNIADHRVFAEFLLPIYFRDVPEERHHRALAGMEFRFSTMRTSRKAYRIRIAATEYTELFDTEIGGYEADYCLLTDKIGVMIIGMSRGCYDHVTLEFSQEKRDDRSPSREEKMAEALHNARSFVRLFAGSDAGLNACIREIDSALNEIPRRYHPKRQS